MAGQVHWWSWYHLNKRMSEPDTAWTTFISKQVAALKLMDLISITKYQLLITDCSDRKRWGKGGNQWRGRSEGWLEVCQWGRHPRVLVASAYQSAGHQGTSVGWGQETQAGKHCKHTQHPHTHDTNNYWYAHKLNTTNNTANNPNIHDTTTPLLPPSLLIYTHSQYH